MPILAQIIQILGQTSVTNYANIGINYANIGIEYSIMSLIMPNIGTNYANIGIDYTVVSLIMPILAQIMPILGYATL